VVPNVLPQDTRHRLFEGCANLVSQVREHDPKGLGIRGRLRYSFGSCSSTGHQVHRPEWAALLDLPVVAQVLEAVWGPGCACTGGGGDVCMPGCLEHQTLHQDCSFRPHVLGTSVPPYIAVNFAVDDLNPFNGPLRQIPRTQHRPYTEAPCPREESLECLLSTVCPVAAGAAIFRDLRCWHGGTPNLSTRWRALPNVEFAAPFAVSDALLKVMPYEVWEGLSEQGRSLARHIVAEKGEWVAPSFKFWPSLGKHCFLRPAQVTPLFQCCQGIFEYEEVD